MLSQLASLVCVCLRALCCDVIIYIYTFKMDDYSNGKRCTNFDRFCNDTKIMLIV